MLYKLQHFETKQIRGKIIKKGYKQSQCCSERRISVNSKMWKKSTRNRYSDKATEFSVLFVCEIEERNIEIIEILTWMQKIIILDISEKRARGHGVN